MAGPYLFLAWPLTVGNAFRFFEGGADPASGVGVARGLEVLPLGAVFPSIALRARSMGCPPFCALSLLLSTLRFFGGGLPLAARPVVIPNPTGAGGSTAFRDLLLPFAFLAGSLL